jgi:lipopolysaccharide/colanic/teichoic acid biosynthesis glycosyltransferase
MTSLDVRGSAPGTGTRVATVGTATGRHRAATGGGWLLPLLDASALVTAGLLVVKRSSFGPDTGGTVTLPDVRESLAIAGYVVAALLLIAGTGRHRPRITLRLGDELPGLLGCALLPGVLLTPVAGGRTLLLVPAVAVTLTIGRNLGYGLLRAARRHGRYAEPTVLVGTGSLAREIAATLAAHPEFGLTPYGFVDSRPPEHVGAPLPWLGDLSALPRVLSAHRIRRVIVCFPALPDADLVPLLRHLRDARVRAHVVPRLYEVGQAATSARDEVWGIPLVPLRQPAAVSQAAGRGLDLVLAGLLLVALAPLLGVLLPIARAASGGPALFRQVRVSGGRLATILKLRSLPPDPDGDTAADTRWAVPDGCTRLGGLLRASHADELPQLVNVLRGEMSLVGPRPERPYFAARFTATIPGYAGRHRVPAGMTGWAQVHGLSGDTSLRERVRFDNRYVEDWSLWTDLVILVRTVAVVARRTVAAVVRPALPRRP